RHVRVARGHAGPDTEPAHSDGRHLCFDVPRARLAVAVRHRGIHDPELGAHSASLSLGSDTEGLAAERDGYRHGARTVDRAREVHDLDSDDLGGGDHHTHHEVVRCGHSAQHQVGGFEIATGNVAQTE